MTTTEPTTQPTIDPDAAIAGFLDAWNATDAGERRAAIERSYTDDGCFSDPTAQVTGHDAIDAHIVATLAVFEGRTFSALGEPDLHHDRVKFEWEMRSPEGSVELVGLEVAHLDAGGRFTDTTGFFLPPG